MDTTTNVNNTNSNCNEDNNQQKQYIASLFELSLLKHEIITKYTSIQNKWASFSSTLDKMNSCIIKEKEDIKDPKHILTNMQMSKYQY